MDTAHPRETGIGASVAALVGGTFVGAFGLLVGTLLTLLAWGFLEFGLGVAVGAAELLVLGLVFTQGVGCAGIALLYTKLRPRISALLRSAVGDRSWVPRPQFTIHASVPSSRELLFAAGGYVAALTLAVLGAVVVSTLGVETGTNQAAATGMENPGVLLLLVPASFLVIGPGEELLFRGVVQGRIREALGPVLGVGLASAIFAGIHYFALTGGTPAGNLVALAVLFFPSLVFGVAYEWTENVVVPALIHGAYNATLFAGLYFAVTLGADGPAVAAAVLLA